ncbi:MAG: hypothetical protein H7X95_13670 [Deltaproteobacteria bacterium]|nr:hypothetical protein [Deltaproteobacteria bacterium]
MLDLPAFHVGQLVYLTSRMADPLEQFEVVAPLAEREFTMPLFGQPSEPKGWLVRSRLGSDLPVSWREVSAEPPNGLYRRHRGMGC